MPVYINIAHFKLCHLNGDETCYFKCEEFGDNYVLTIAANDQSRERQVQMEVSIKCYLFFYQF